MRVDTAPRGAHPKRGVVWSTGPIRSVCPHGDSRAPQVSNAALLEGEDWASYGIELDELPMVPERILEAIDRRGGADATPRERRAEVPRT